MDDIQKRKPKEHAYTLVLTNESTSVWLVPVGVPLSIDYFSMTVVGSSCDDSRNKTNGLQVWTNENAQIFTPAGIAALTLSPSGKQTIRLPLVTSAGNTKIDVSLAIVIPPVPVGGTIQIALIGDILRDGRSIFGGKQTLVTASIVGTPALTTSAERLVSFTLFDLQLCPGEHVYQLVLINQSTLDSQPNQLILDTLTFNILAPSPTSRNITSVIQNFPLMGIPALTLAPLSSASFDVLVKKGAQSVKLNGFVNFILQGSGTFILQYDFLRDGQSIRRTPSHSQ